LAAVARRDARQLNCDVAAGPTELLERPDVDALLLPDRQWFGLWPLDPASRVGKPVLCGRSVVYQEPAPEVALQRVQDRRLPVMVGIATPPPEIVRCLAALFAEQLGPPRLLMARVLAPQQRQASLHHLIGLLGWCAAVLEDCPRRLLATTTAATMASLLLDYGDCRAAQLTAASGSGNAQGWQFQVVAERGTAIVERGQLRWESPEGRFCRTLPPGRRGPGGSLEAFRQALAAGQLPQPDLAWALRLFGWLRQAEHSLEQGGWVSVQP
jgi:hypothetical protein